LQPTKAGSFDKGFRAGGRTDIQNRKAMTLDTTLTAYSMARTFSAVAILQFIDHGKLRLDNEIDRYLPDIPYDGPHINPL
jgi:CubicO group peptidase (beta-lactamase class C family)